MRRMNVRSRFVISKAKREKGGDDSCNIALHSLVLKLVYRQITAIGKKVPSTLIF